MPENSETAVIADCLKRKLLGKQLNKCKYGDVIKVTNYDKLLLPAIIKNVTFYGEKVIIELKKQYIIIGLGMSGKFVYEKMNHNHVKFVFDDLILYYNNVRTIGSEIIVSDNLRLSKLGPCLLTAALTTWIDKKEWYGLFKKTNRCIVGALSDQRVLAGVGNYLRSEILYLAGVDPFKMTKDVSKNEYELIRIAAHEVVLYSYKLGGHTLFDYVDPEGKKGGYVPLVYRKKTDMNGFVVKKRKVNGQYVHYVKEVQN